MWTIQRVEKEIREVMRNLEIDTFPTRKQMAQESKHQLIKVLTSFGSKEELSKKFNIPKSKRKAVEKMINVPKDIDVKKAYDLKKLRRMVKVNDELKIDYALSGNKEKVSGRVMQKTNHFVTVKKSDGFLTGFNWQDLIYHESFLNGMPIKELVQVEL